jgi:lysozyme
MTDADIQRAIRVLIWLLERFEGLYLRPYLCPAAKWTVGLGSLRYLDGRPVRPGDPPITREHAYILAESQIRAEYLPAVLAQCPAIDTSSRLAAITSFAYNLGTTALRGSTLRKRINAEAWEQACDELMRWTKGGGRVLPGLVKRRAAESRLMWG